MPVKIVENMQGSVAVLTIKGKLMGGPEMKELHDHVKGLIHDGVKRVVIDLGRVKWLNSSGLGALMGALTTLRGASGELKLANASDKIQSLLMITKLMSIFDTHENVEKAIAAFGEPGE